MHIFCDNENLHLLLESTLCLSITFDCICKSIFFLILPYYYFIQIKVLPLLSITLSPCNIWTAYSICSTKRTRLMSNIWTKSTEIESICFISSSYLGSWKCSLCIIHSAEAVRSWNCQSRFAGTKILLLDKPFLRPEQRVMSETCSKFRRNDSFSVHVYSVALNVRSVLSTQLAAYCPSLNGLCVRECVFKAYSAFSSPKQKEKSNTVWVQTGFSLLWVESLK